MRFLPEELVRPHLLPLNILYHNPGMNGGNWEDDVLTIIYKDQDTDVKNIYEILNPEIEIYIVKPEFRKFDHMRDMIEMNKCDKFKVQYRTRWSFAAKKLNLPSSDDAKNSPYVFGADIPIETYYLIQFISEYPSDKPKMLSLGKLDIENDIIRYGKDYPGHGETPINAVTYINMETDDVYTLILLKDDIPETSPYHPEHQYYENLRKHFYEQVAEISTNRGLMEQLCHEKFDEMYPGMKYNIIYYDNEVTLLEDLWRIIHQCNNDFGGAWNNPYDMQNIFERMRKLGMDVERIICDEESCIKKVFFKEDTSPIFHKRKHQCTTYTITSFVDDLTLYSGVHAGGGVLPSHKLNYIAQKELKDEKYDYSEYSDIVHLFYDDLKRFILYNIKDVLLLVGIERKCHIMDIIYSRMYQMFVFPSEAFTTTKVVWHSLMKFMTDRGYIFGTNRNKGKHTKTIINYGEKLGREISNPKSREDGPESLADELDGMLFDIDDPDSEEDDTGEKYEGAIVANPLHMKPSGVMISGKPAKYIHDNVADEDIASDKHLILKRLVFSQSK